MATNRRSVFQGAETRQLSDKTGIFAPAGEFMRLPRGVKARFLFAGESARHKNVLKNSEISSKKEKRATLWLRSSRRPFVYRTKLPAGRLVLNSLLFRRTLSPPPAELLFVSPAN